MTTSSGRRRLAATSMRRSVSTVIARTPSCATSSTARLPSLMPSRCSRKGARSAGSSSDCSVVRTRSATTSGVSRSSMPHWLRTRSMMGRYGMAAPYERQRTSSVVTSVAPRLRRNS